MNSYALVDGVMRQTAIKDLYSRKEPIQVMPLYINTPYKENYDLGPILVAALEGSSLITSLKHAWVKSTTFLYSKETLHTVADHLKQFITVTDETGSSSLLRFADPLITWHWLNSYEANAQVDILGPIEKWQVAKPIPDWQEQTIEWEFFSKQSEAEQLNLTLNYLYEPQVQALDKAAAFRFKNRMYNWLIKEKPQVFADKTSNQVCQWLDTSYQDAKSFNLISERSIAVWINLCADYGLDFATLNDGVYENWFREHPQNKGLPPEVNIQKFYEYLVELNATSIAKAV